jgi:two-component system, chemotaxis family, chemotaxis protein CheY
MNGSDSGKRIRTLVVEDSAPVRRAICLFLEERRGIQIVGTARDGCEALEQVKILRPDLVLTDWLMPKMDGLRLTAQVRKLDPAIRVILLTVYDSPEIRIASHAYGVDGVVATEHLYQELPSELLRIFPRLDR